MIKMNFTGKNCCAASLSLIIALAAQPLRASDKQRSLTVTFESWPQRTHPHAASLMEAYFVFDQIYEPLIERSPKGDFVQNLIEKWTLSDDFRSIDCVLAKGVSFSDGTPLTAEHVRKTFESILLTDAVKGMEAIVGSGDFVAHKTPSLAGFLIEGSQHFKILFSSPQPRSLELLSHKTLAPALEVSRSQLPLGTGAYKLNTWDELSETITLSRNLHRSLPSGHLETILFKTVSHDGSLVMEFPGAKHNPSATKSISYFDIEVTLLGFNMDLPILQDVEMRRYLTSLLPADTARKIYANVDYPVGSIIPIGYPGYSPNASSSGPQSQPAVIKGKTINVGYYLQKFADAADGYCAALKKVKVGCRTVFTSQKEFIARIRRGKTHVFFSRMRPESSEELLGAFTSSSIFNIFFAKQTKNNVQKDIDALFGKLMATSTGEHNTIEGYLSKLDRMIRNDGVAMPIAYGGQRQVRASPKMIIPRFVTPFDIKIRDIAVQKP